MQVQPQRSKALRHPERLVSDLALRAGWQLPTRTFQHCYQQHQCALKFYFIILTRFQNVVMFSNLAWFNNCVLLSHSRKAMPTLQRHERKRMCSKYHNLSIRFFRIKPDLQVVYTRIKHFGISVVLVFKLLINEYDNNVDFINYHRNLR